MRVYEKFIQNHCGAVRGEVSLEILGVKVRNVVHIMLSNRESEGKAQK